MKYDVAVIGGGVVGGLILRELSRYRLTVILLEKEEDVAMGASRANSGIVHAGYDAVPGTRKAKYNVLGSRMMEKITRELSVPYTRNGSLVLAFHEKERETLNVLQNRGIQNGLDDLRILSPEEVWRMEPNISKDIVGALYAPSGAIVCPYELTLAAIENAMDNGAELKTGFPAEQIRQMGDGFLISGKSGTVEARYIVNAAGVYADEVAGMVGDNSFSITPRRGEYELLDKAQGEQVHCTVFQTPSNMGKGILVTPTADGNLLTGPTSVNIADKEDLSATAEGLEYVRTLAKRSVPGIQYNMVITSFAGLRAVPDTGDFILGPVPGVPHFINAAGIESPGLSSSPAIAEAVIKFLEEAGLSLEKKSNYNPIRRPFPKFREMSDAERTALIQENSAFGRIVCRCEQITEGEILEAIRRNPPASSVDAVKRRTRAGMGRCQGGFCGPQVVEILSRELGIPMEEVTKSGGASRMLTGSVGKDRRVIR